MKNRVIKILFFFVFTLLVSQKLFADSARFDGAWWLSVSKSQRISFLDGYFDCLVNDVVDNIPKPDCPTPTIEGGITAYYKTHQSELGVEVIAIYFSLCGPGSDQKSAPNGEVYSGKHGFFSGDYWQQLENDERLGFIQGYTECQKKYNKPIASFTQSQIWYSTQISQWYGVDPNDSDHVDNQLFTIEKRYMVAIADVLFAINKSGGASAVSLSSIIKTNKSLKKKMDKAKTK